MFRHGDSAYVAPFDVAVAAPRGDAASALQTRGGAQAFNARNSGRFFD